MRDQRCSAVLFLCAVLFVFELLPGNGHPGGGDLSVQQLPELSERFVQLVPERLLRLLPQRFVQFVRAKWLLRQWTLRDVPAGSLPIGELFGQLSERPMHAGPQPRLPRFARRFVCAELLAARLFPAGTAVFADKLVERPAFSPQLRPGPVRSGQPRPRQRIGEPVLQLTQCE